MLGESKKFDRTLHQGNDPKSRQVVKDYLAKQGFIVEDNTNQYGVDLVSEDGAIQVEVEHRLPWTGERFPFSEINVPERKAKFFRNGKVHYVILSKDYSRLGIILGKNIQTFMGNDNLVENPNKFVKNNELFFKVPCNQFRWIKI